MASLNQFDDNPSLGLVETVHKLTGNLVLTAIVVIAVPVGLVIAVVGYIGIELYKALKGPA